MYTKCNHHINTPVESNLKIKFDRYIDYINNHNKEDLVLDFTPATWNISWANHIKEA
jgi:hypothetical protein